MSCKLYVNPSVTEQDKALACLTCAVIAEIPTELVPETVSSMTKFHLP